MSIESVIPSNHLVLCRPLLLPSVLALHVRRPKYWSFSFSPSNTCSGLISFGIALILLCGIPPKEFGGIFLQVTGFESIGGAAPNLGVDSNPKEAKREQAWGQQEQDGTGDGGRVLGGGREGDVGGVWVVGSCLNKKQPPPWPPPPKKIYCRDSLFDSLEKKIWSQESKITALLKKGLKKKKSRIDTFPVTLLPG